MEGSLERGVASRVDGVLCAAGERIKSRGVFLTASGVE